jgi:hypothetical protein
MLVLVAVDAEQLPVAAIQRIVIVIMILMVNREFAQAHAGELAGAAAADPRIEFERAFAIGGFALAAVPAGFGYDAIQARLIGDWGLGHDRELDDQGNAHFTKGRA